MRIVQVLACDQIRMESWTCWQSNSMASGEHLRQLFQSYMRREDHEFRSVALKIVAEERQKNHHSLADQLERILANGWPVGRELSAYAPEDLPRDKERSSLLVEVRTPRRFFEEMILSEENRQIIAGLLQEYRRGEVLKTHGLRPRTKLLFSGPPGCGKTYVRRGNRVGVRPSAALHSF